MASRSNLPPPRFRPPRPRPVRAGRRPMATDESMSIDLDPASIDTDELLQGLDGGPRGDDGEDLGGADLFGSDADGSGGGGGDGDGMATPSSDASTVTATATPRGRGHRTTKTRARTSNVWNDFDELFHVVNGK